MKNILLLIHDDAGQESRFQAAIDLTKAVDGHLTCLDVAVLPLALASDYYSIEGQGMVLDMEREREAANKLELEHRLAREGVTWTWVDTTNMLGDALLDSANLADLIVLNRKLDTVRSPDMAGIVSQVVMHTSKPVVAVPETSRGFDTRRALIAWDGCSSCVEALRACVPLLAMADEVELFMVRDGAVNTDPIEAAAYLSRHGIHPIIRIEDDAATPIDMLIMEECKYWDASYLVMGAFGRGRLMELFGGTTKRMLAGSPVPLVLVH